MNDFYADAMEHDAQLFALQEIARTEGLVVEGDETVDELTEAMFYLAESFARR